jgi:molybdopterin/thiamine biosynthesis adenylyltransferase
VSLPALVEPAAELSIDEVRRYSRHLIIPDVGMTGQKRLKNAKVLVIGAGGLGSPALLYLAAAGVGTLGIAEFDTVDESNLQRQVIHGVSDIDKPKGQSAKESIAEINPYVNVILHTERLDNDNVFDVFRGYDLIVDGTDNFATRYMVNDAAYFLKIPYAVDGRGRAVLPLPLPRAPAARHGAELRRGRRARRPVREHRLDPGQRGHQAAHRDR